MFLSEYSVPSTPSRKRKFSNTFSRVEIFENGDLSYSCGRAKTEVFKYDDVMPRFEARSSARMVRKCFVWTLIFLNTEEKVTFSKKPGCVWTVRYDSKALRVDAYVWSSLLHASLKHEIQHRVNGFGYLHIRILGY